jgi:hypothetical protein
MPHSSIKVDDSDNSEVDYSMEPIDEVEPEFDTRDEIEFFNKKPINHPRKANSGSWLHETDYSLSQMDNKETNDKEIETKVNQYFKHLQASNSNKLNTNHVEIATESEYKPNPPKPHVKRDNNISDIDTFLINNILIQDFKIEIEPPSEPLKKENNQPMDTSNAFSERLEHIILSTQTYQPSLTQPSPTQLNLIPNPAISKIA